MCRIFRLDIFYWKLFFYCYFNKNNCIFFSLLDKIKLINFVECLGIIFSFLVVVVRLRRIKYGLDVDYIFRRKIFLCGL